MSAESDSAENMYHLFGDVYVHVTATVGVLLLLCGLFSFTSFPFWIRLLGEPGAEFVRSNPQVSVWLFNNWNAIALALLGGAIGLAFTLDNSG